MSQIVCLDASVIIRYLTSTDSQSIYQQSWNQWKSRGDILVAPTLIMYEIANAFHRAVIAGQLTSREAEAFLEQAFNLGLRLYGDSQLHREALKIAEQYSLRATYDAHYLALAQRLGINFWTADQRLYNTVNNSLNWVYLLQ
jgi:predicted nucleic acid-binding protein